ncbi:MAG: radical SAM protein, partial [Prevotellaceae bacterium]|nr:radical SAM protein [Prevotellaceae bacterium]
MRIGLMAEDSRHPNLALMKISAWHKGRGDTVEWYDSLAPHYDIVYVSKIFNFTPRYAYCIGNADKVERGGTGYSLQKELPPGIDRTQPDYSIYPQVDGRTAYGFLTRGCPNKCKWCVVPEKEGALRPYMDVEEIAVDGRDRLILMDNNILASDYGLSQIEKIVRLGYKVDFNQALDARLVTDDVAALLARVRWISRIRFGCDTPAQVSHCDTAIRRIEARGYKGEFFLFCMLHGDLNECYERVSRWRTPRHLAYAQPFRDPRSPNSVPQWQKDM